MLIILAANYNSQCDLFASTLPFHDYFNAPVPKMTAFAPATPTIGRQSDAEAA
jgi:hypothetical protein